MGIYDEIKRNPVNVSPKQLIELLTTYGFERQRMTGDHEMYKKPGYRTFPIPIKQKPLARHIIKEALLIIDEIRANEDYE